jgi:anaerobic magnesium-protoporphyrin IX monomethyl ester cyclase
MTDSLIIGFSDSNFGEYEQMVRAMGADSGAYRDLNLAFVSYNNKPYRSLDILSHFYLEPDNGGKLPRHAKGFHNADFMWPVVLYLGSYLHRRGFSFDYVNLFHLEKDKLKDKLLHDDILTIAITTTLYVTPHPIVEIINFIRQYNDKVKIIVGGPYIHNQSRMGDQITLHRLYKLIGADFYVISQEGEETLANLIATLKAGASLDSVDNIAYKKDSKYVVTASRVESNPLEENPVDYSLFPRSEVGEFISLRTAKSCPFACSFCGFPQRAGKYTYTDVSLVEKELNLLADLGVTTLTFLDDTFNVPKARFREILKMMANNKYGFKWNSFYRSDHGDEETIELMGKAGCEGVFLGVESGSDKLLETMNKTSRRHNYMKAIPLLQAAGISAYASIIIGFPSETYETVQESISLIEEAKPDFFRAQLWYADPMTPIWNQREQYGVKGGMFNWSHNTMDSQMACDLIEKMFLSVENSVWMPQNGFEQWSIFYLQRKGMTLDQIKTFLRYFNAGVRQKLIDPQATEIAPDIVEGLRRSSRFEDEAEPDDRAMRELPGEYKAAEQYWVREFWTDATDEKNNSTKLEGEQADQTTAQAHVVETHIDKSLLDQLKAATAKGINETLLAVLGVLVSRMSGKEESFVLNITNSEAGRQAIPLKITSRWEMSFADFLSHVVERLEAGRKHSKYALHILTNPWRMKEFGSKCPEFEIGYEYFEEKGEIAHGDRSSNSLIGSLAQILEVTETAEDVSLKLRYDGDKYSRARMEKMADYLLEIINEVIKNPAAAIGAIEMESVTEKAGDSVELDALEEFSF